MILEILSIGPRLAMLMQNDLWNDISAFLHLLLDPILIALEDVVLRRTLLSTISLSVIMHEMLVTSLYLKKISTSDDIVSLSSEATIQSPITIDSP